MARIAYILLLLSSFACQYKGEEESGALIAGNQEVTNKFTVTLPASKSYLVGENLDYTLSFPYAVTVTGTPRLTLTVGSTTRYANYVSGTGTTDLLFRYTVVATELDTNGVALASTVGLNGGTLTYTGTNGPDNCSTSFSVPSVAGVKVDTVAPTVSSIPSPTAGTYYTGYPINFLVTMSEKVAVTGTPRLTLTVGAATRYATYVSGSGTTTLLFRYTPSAGDVDTNGIGVAAAIDLNSGTLKDIAGNNATLTFAAPNTAAVLVDGNSPYVTAVTPPANGNYGMNDNLDFTFTYSEAVNVTGIPTLNVTIGSTVRAAAYYSGSGSTQLTYRYVVQAGEVDSNGIATGATFNMAGATVRDGSLTNAVNGFVMPTLTGVKVVDDRPVINSFLVNNATYYIGQSFTLTALFNQAVTITGTPRIMLTLNTGGPVYATYVSGSGTSNIVFSYTVAEGTDDNNGVVITSPADLNGGTIKNAEGVDANLVFTQPSTANLRVSGIKPTVLSVTPPTDGSYMTSQNMDFLVNFSETVVAGSTANIKLNLDIGGNARQANYVSGSGTSTLRFRYTVTVADFDNDGPTVGTIALTGAGYISDGTSTHNLAVLTLTPPDTDGVLVNVDAPLITAVTPPGDATYVVGQDLDFTLTYDEAVNVTGTPRLQLTIGVVTAYATYVSGSGTTDLVFRYTVGSGDVDSDGISASTTLDNNGGSIIGDVGGVAASPGVPLIDLSNVLVDGQGPSITTVTPLSDGAYTINDTSLDFTVQWDEDVSVSGTPRLEITVGQNTRYAEYASGDGTDTLTFTYALDAADLALDGLVLENSNEIDLNGGTIQDASGNAAELDLGAQDLSGIMVNFPGLETWWDVDHVASITTATCGGSDCVSMLAARGGGSIHATAAGAARPEYISSGFGGGNRAHLQYDGTAMVMGSGAINPVRTVFIVFESGNMSMDEDIFYESGLSPRIRVATSGDLSLGSSGRYSLNGGGMSSSDTDHTAGLSATTPYVLAVQYDSDENFSSPGLGAPDFDGKIAEILVYSSALSDTEIDAIIQYLNGKHQIY